MRIHRSLGRDGAEDETKTSSERVWVAEPNVLPLLRALVGDVGGRGLLLPDWSRTTYAKSLRRHLLTAGVERPEIYVSDSTRRPLSGHDLRATGITWRANRGDSVTDIRDDVGHRSLATTGRYIRRGRQLARLFEGQVFPELPAELLESGRAQRAPAITDGPCRRCGAKGLGPRCRACLAAAARYARKRGKRLRKARLCLVCQAPVHVTEAGKRRTLCAEHLAYYRERSKNAAIRRRSEKS